MLGMNLTAKEAKGMSNLKKEVTSTKELHRVLNTIENAAAAGWTSLTFSDCDPLSIYTMKELKNRGFYVLQHRRTTMICW